MTREGESESGSESEAAPSPNAENAEAETGSCWDDAGDASNKQEPINCPDKPQSANDDA